MKSIFIQNFTTENFTLIQKTLLHEKYFYTKLEPIKIPFSIRKLIFFFVLSYVRRKRKINIFKLLQNDFIEV